MQERISFISSPAPVHSSHPSRGIAEGRGVVQRRPPCVWRSETKTWKMSKRALNVFYFLHASSGWVRSPVVHESESHTGNGVGVALQRFGEVIWVPIDSFSCIIRRGNCMVHAGLTNCRSRSLCKSDLVDATNVTFIAILKNCAMCTTRIQGLFIIPAFSTAYIRPRTLLSDTC